MFTRAARLRTYHLRSPDAEKDQISARTMADEDLKLFEQCRICIVCSNDLPLETAEQVRSAPK